MAKRSFLAAGIIVSFFLTLSAGAVVFTDNFNTARNYLTEGVGSSGWDGFVGLGANETVNKLNASIDRAGKLYMESQGAVWEPSWVPLGPFLYKNVSGDFIVTVKVEEAANLQWNDCGIMARVANLDDAGSGEDFECVDHFLYIGVNMVRGVDNGAESEVTTSPTKSYLKLTRLGNTFYHEVSDDGVTWTMLSGSPRTRNDMAGLPLQVGLQHATYSAAAGFVVYENFAISEPPPYASNPNPADNSENKAVNLTCTWTQGAGAESHDFYIGTSFNDVNNANNNWPVGGVYKGNLPLSPCSYTPTGLQEGRRYYWRVDERSGATIYKGAVWSFVTFNNALEDFEIYTDTADLTQSWVPSETAEVTLATDVYHNGGQSMKLSYYNGGSPYYAYATRQLNPSQDWTDYQLRSISIYFKGNAANQAAQMYLIVEDAGWQAGRTIIPYEGDPENLKLEVWQRWDVRLAGAVEENPVFRLGDVSKISVAMGNPDNPAAGGTGFIYIDDIALHSARCIDKNEALADFDGNCRVDANDLLILAQRWLSSGSEADAWEDRYIDFKDEAVLANKWLEEYAAWPKLVDPDEFLTAVPFYDVNVVGGFWGQRMQTDRDVTIWHNFQMCESTGRINNFYKAAGLMSGSHEGAIYNDSDVYKVIEAAGYSLHLFPDPTLEAYVDTLIDVIEQAQWDDGYLFTPYSIPHQPSLRWTNIAWNHELYCAGHFFEGAVAYYEATGNTKILNVATEFANYIDTVFGPGKHMYPPGHQEIELALMKLYKLTGDVRYFNLTKFFVDQRGNSAGHTLYGEYSQDYIPLVEQDSGVGHAVRAGYYYAGAVDIVRENYDEAYMNALNNIWDNIVSAKMYLTGGLGQPGGPEGFTTDYALANNSYCETCAAIASALWNNRMFLLTGDGKYLDIMERTLLNGVLSGLSLAGNRYFYTNPLSAAGNQRAEWYGTACCPPNLARVVMSIGGRAYAYKGRDIYVNMYMNGTAQIPAAGNNVGLIVDTNYPWDGDIQITVNPQQAGNFGIFLRIPSWVKGKPSPTDLYKYVNDEAETVTLTVNGVPVDVSTQKSFACIRRSWQAGDVIGLNLPMPIRHTIAHPLVTADEGLVALERGPIVYCAEWADFNDGRFSHLVITDDANLSAEYRTNLLNSQTIVTDGTVLTGTVKGAYLLEGGGLELRDEAFTAMPYYAWAHRGGGLMKVWLPRDPNKATPISPPGPQVRELQGFWKLDETSGTTASDSSGKGMAGTCMNGLSFSSNSVNGKFGKALKFDGSNDYIDVPDGFTNFEAGLTISVWAYPTAVKNYARFIDFGNGAATNNLAFSRVGTSNDLFCEVWVEGSNGGRVTASNAIELNKWQMFTVTVSSTGSTKIYKNGSVIATGNTGVPQNLARTQNYIGRSNWGADAYYQGNMDDVRIYSYALDDVAVAALYIGGRAENPSPTDEKSGVAVTDVLSWIGGSTAAQHDVYLGTNETSVTDAVFGSPEHKIRHALTSYDPPTLLANTQYFWRIDEVTASSGTIKGAVWSFTTAP